jgi:hypothetical protein
MSNWSLFCHNYNLIGADKPPVWPEGSPLPQCIPYACDAFTTEQISLSPEYLWLLNDKETTYSGPMIEEISNSQLLLATGNVSNTGQVATLMDSCSGITAWQIRDNNTQNASTLRLYQDPTYALILSGFSYSQVISKHTTSVIRMQPILVHYAYQGNGLSQAINMSVVIDDYDTITVGVTPSPYAPYSESFTLPTPIEDDTPFLLYVEYNHTESTKVWLNNVLVADFIYINPLPPPYEPYGTAHILFCDNSTWTSQNLSIKSSNLSGTQLNNLDIAFQRNFTGYQLPPECS